MQEQIDDRLSWLTQHLGGTGDKLAIITTCLLHAGYFLLATLCILFLNAPLFTRLVLLILVPINAWSEIKFRSRLSYGSLSCLLTLALIGKYFFVLSVSSIKLSKKDFPLFWGYAAPGLRRYPIFPPLCSDYKFLCPCCQSGPGLPFAAFGLNWEILFV